jgi:hypothetical protein
MRAMSDTNPRRARLVARLDAEARTQISPPDVICLPDQSAPAAIEIHSPKKGRHLGGRRVAEPRSAWLTTRCTPTFRAAVETAALAGGQTLADYVHARLSDQRYAPRFKQRAAPDIDVLRKILAQMGKLGGNLNQLAYHMNSCDDRDAAAELVTMRADHEAALAQHRLVCAAILTALGV